MRYIKGTELVPHEQREVLASYVYRFTREHRPLWANKPRDNGRTYPVRFDSDQDWLEHTEFAVAVEALQECAALLDIVWAHDDDVFGIAHNDATDTDIKIRRIIADS